MRKITAFFFIVCLSLSAFAQKLTVEAPNLVAADEQFTVTFTIEGEDKPSDFNWAPSDAFQLVWGPQQGRSSSVSIINGVKSQSVTYTYTYILLPKKTGKFTIPSASAKVKGKELSCRETVIEVVSNGTSSSSSSQAQSGQPRQSQQPQGDVSDISSEDMFLKMNFSRTSVVVGEPITATLKLYQRVNITGLDDAKFPSFNGFWSQDLTPQGDIQFVRENINDKIYNSAVIKKYILIPQQAGKIAIEPSELVCRITVRTAPRGGSIFDGFFDDYATVRKRVTAPGCTINVSPLPSGAPASFAGGVGTFNVSAKLSKDSLATHEAASLLVTVSGKGNISLLEAPKVSFPPDFEVYDIKTTDRIDKSSGGITGSKTYEYPFIPRSHGDFTLEPVKYSYYDVSAGKYVTLQTEPIDFTVVRGKESESSQSTAALQNLPAAAPRKGVKNLGEDIRFIRTKAPAFTPEGRFFLGSLSFWSVLLGLVILAAVLWLVLRKAAAMRSDVVGAKNRKATKMALRRLAKAGEYLSSKLYSAFYEELHKALLGFVSDKFNMAATELSKDGIASALAKEGVPQGLVNDFTSLLDECEFARYAPSDAPDAMQTHYDKAVTIISAMDSSIKKGGKALAIAITLLLASTSSLFAQNPDSLFNAAAAAYTEGHWEDASRCWKSILDAGYSSAEVCYNIANASFKASDYASAVLYYERALKLDPSFADAKYNLEIVSAYTQDSIDPVPELILKTWLRKLCYIMDSNSWAWTGIAIFALFLAMALLFLLAPSRGARKTGFFAGIVLFMLALSSFGLSKWEKNDALSDEHAIVMRPVSSVKSSPSSESTTDLFLLHEGTKVSIVDKVGDWTNIELADGRQGWIRSSDIEVI